jgi:hypothetical protein
VCHEVLERNPAFAKQQGFSLSRHTDYKRKRKI